MSVEEAVKSAFPDYPETHSILRMMLTTHSAPIEVLPTLAEHHGTILSSYDRRKALRFLEDLSIHNGNLNSERIAEQAKQPYDRMRVSVQNIPLLYLAAIGMIRRDFGDTTQSASKPTFTIVNDRWRLTTHYKGPQGSLSFALIRQAPWIPDITPDVYDFFNERNPYHVNFNRKEGSTSSDVHAQFKADPKRHVELLDHWESTARNPEKGKEAMEGALYEFYGAARPIDVRVFADYLRQKHIEFEDLK
ncbi:MAG: hypothetical protein AABX70_05290 [Nanoarchaeota archaeon]